MTLPRIRLYVDRAMEFRWTKYSNGEPIADSDEGLENFQHALKMAIDEVPEGGGIVEIPQGHTVPEEFEKKLYDKNAVLVVAPDDAA